MGTWTISTTNYSVGYRFGQALFIPAAGYRDTSNGSLNNRGSIGYYWSSSESGSSAPNLYFTSGVVGMTGNNRANGFSLRCVAE